MGRFGDSIDSRGEPRTGGPSREGLHGHLQTPAGMRSRSRAMFASVMQVCGASCTGLAEPRVTFKIGGSAGSKPAWTPVSLRTTDDSPLIRCESGSVGVAATSVQRQRAPGRRMAVGRTRRRQPRPGTPLRRSRRGCNRVPPSLSVVPPSWCARGLLFAASGLLRAWHRFGHTTRQRRAEGLF